MGPHLCFVQVEDAQFEVHALTASWETHTLKALSVTPLSCLPFSKLQVFLKVLDGKAIWKGNITMVIKQNMLTETVHRFPTPSN